MTERSILVLLGTTAGGVASLSCLAMWAGTGGLDTDHNCSDIQNTCPDYSSSWQTTCPAGARCVQFTNACSDAVALSYNVGCNGDGTPGSPQCSCGPGQLLENGDSAYWVLVNGDYSTCPEAYSPACLTEGLAVMANYTASSCTGGTRVEFTTGNEGDLYDRFDSYDIDLEKGFTVPVSIAPVLNGDCAKDNLWHDCRTVVCTEADCPDAYLTPTSGGCTDGRSPQVGCQDTFNENNGFVVTYCPTEGTSCSNAKPCQ